jgi:bifunctional DNase/RNase
MANIEMVIDDIRVSQMNNQPVIILKEKKGARHLPIWTGQTEADAIAVKMHNVPLERPLTHDLLCAAINTLGASVESVNIAGLKKDTYLAFMVLWTGKEEKQMYLDCRPSDGLAIAVREDVPIYADEEVLKKAGVLLDKKTGKPLEPSSEGVPMTQAEGDESIDILSESVQDILDASEAEAKRMNCSYVCTGHVLMALSKKMSTATKVMEDAGVRVGRIQLDIQALMKGEQAIEGGGVGLTPAVEEVIKVSIAETKKLGSGKVLPEQLLLGLVRASDGIAANHLKNLGITPETVYLGLIRHFHPYTLRVPIF